MLMTTVVIHVLFFAGVPFDVMKHEGSNWRNMATTADNGRWVQSKRGRRDNGIVRHLMPCQRALGLGKRLDAQISRADGLRDERCEMSNSKNNPEATFSVEQ